MALHPGRLGRPSASALLILVICVLVFPASPARGQGGPAAEVSPGAPAGTADSARTPVGSADQAEPPPAPPENVQATDLPNDAGNGLLLRWRPSPDEARVLVYELGRPPRPDAPESTWAVVASIPRGTTTFSYSAPEPELNGKPNPAYIAPGKPVRLAMRSRTAGGTAGPWSPVVEALPRGNWFDRSAVNILVAVILFGAVTVYFIHQGRRGRELYIRPIPGVSAVDEAIGRATEMGRPILFVLGTGTAGDIATIAGYTILARVARRTAEYQTTVLVPVNDPVMMVMAQETVKEAYLEAGRPEVYQPETISYISAMQFPYVAAVNGLMLRQKTATNFYMGVFHAEALILAEAGSVTGSIQISGTDQVAQIPFFVAATDYTLIGEELYAASAYLSQEPALLGPLKAQDWAKIVILVVVLVSVLLVTLTGRNWLAPLVHTTG